MLVTEIANDIFKSAGWGRSEKRAIVDDRFDRVIVSMVQNGSIDAPSASFLSSIHYGISWYVETCRADGELANELKCLSGRMIVRLVVKMYLDGIKVSADVGPWLQSHRGILRRSAMS